MGWSAAVLVLAVVVWALGPRPPRLRLDPELPPAPADAFAAAARLEAHEDAEPLPIKPDNRARVLWAGKPGVRSDWAIAYLHGYSASWREGAPTVPDTARRYGANLLLTRLAGHGLVTDEPLLDLKAEELWRDAKEALVLAGALGRRVVLMATSSGAPLALKLAALYPERVQGLVLYSPNIRIRQALAPLMTWPWGLTVARWVKGGRYNVWEATPEEARYWYPRQRLEGAVQLQRLLDAAYEGDTLRRVVQPVFMGVYYRDAAHQDRSISVAAAREAFARLGTPKERRVFVEYPDAGQHVIACDLSSASWQAVRADTWRFLEEILHLKPRSNTD